MVDTDGGFYIMSRIILGVMQAHAGFLDTTVLSNHSFVNSLNCITGLYGLEVLIKVGGQIQLVTHQK